MGERGGRQPVDPCDECGERGGRQPVDPYGECGERVAPRTGAADVTMLDTWAEERGIFARQVARAARCWVLARSHASQVAGSSAILCVQCTSKASFSAGVIP